MFPVLNSRAAPSAQGQSASFNGGALESRVEMFLKGYGYAKCKARQANESAPYFVTQMREPGSFMSIYGKEQRIDFFIFHPEKYPRGMLFECKHQATAGSVDLKLPYTVLSLKASGIPSILLLEGDGATKHAIDWCRAQQDAQFLFMHGFREFQQQAQRGLF